MASLPVCQAQENPAMAEAAPARLPEWVVLALKPISANRVRPVTGVVVSEDGLVLVPGDFAAPGDQIIVLDGGADIIANGRAATVKTQTAGLTVISAPGLKRRPASFSSQPLMPDETVHLAAFPPAELISQGEAPIWLPARLDAAISLKDLPNVSGPLIDACGNLTGFSAADGVQSMDTSKSPTYYWKDEIRQTLSLVSVSLPEANCDEAIAATAAAPGQEDADPAAQEDDLGEELTPGSPVADSAGSIANGETSADAEESRSNWLPGVGLLVFLGLAGLAWFGFRRRSNSSEKHQIKPSGSLLTGEDYGRTHSASRNSTDLPQPGSFVEVNGRLANGSPFLCTCEVNEAAIDVLIGRGEVDISIDSEVVHRQHARLSGSADGLTLTDVGSSSGTWINRVPCLKGEIMFVGPEDTVFLGDVSMRITVRSAKTGTVRSEDDFRT